MAPTNQGTKAASIRFLKSLDLYEREKPYVVYFAPDKSVEGARRTNIETEEKEGILVEDIRDKRHEFTLDTHGFEAFTHLMSFTDFDDDEKVQQDYLKEVEEVIRKRIPEATDICVFDWRVRQ
jgi:hypothetical protein